MTQAKFSGRGDTCTPFEQALVDHNELDDSVWTTIAKRIGATNLAVVLDELGSEKIHVPTREDFFQRLYRPLRDAEIQYLADVVGLNQPEIAARLEVSQGLVSKALSRRRTPRMRSSW